jgi:hypothetical protein
MESNGDFTPKPGGVGDTAVVAGTEVVGGIVKDITKSVVQEITGTDQAVGEKESSSNPTIVVVENNKQQPADPTKSETIKNAPINELGKTVIQSVTTPLIPKA